jgi:hypothetical protein
MLGLSLALAVSGTVLAKTTKPDALPHPVLMNPPPEAETLPSLTYARVLTGNVPIYSQPIHASQGLSPTRTLDPGYVWVTLADSNPIRFLDQAWYAINADEFVQADYLEIYQPATFQGMAITVPKRFAWMIFDAWSAAVPGELPGDNTILFKRYDQVTIYETERVEDRDWYRVGPDQWLEQGMVGIVQPKPRPKGIGRHEKWIEVDLYEQTLAAYQGDRMVYATLVSSGLPWWQTETGLFQIWIKVRQAKMSGRAGYPDYYFLEDVPWTMYFNGEFALHGAYWHDRFGIQHSHGCVNLPPQDARWLFEWSTPSGQTNWIPTTEEKPGTWVWVHE